VAIQSDEVLSRADVGPFLEGLGRELRARRLQAGVGQRALARDVGVSASLISQIEHGRSIPSVGTLYAIVNRLGISLDEIFKMGAWRGEDGDPTDG
jgi:transcriptional regulator with XRE-family HTH domain